MGTIYNSKYRSGPYIEMHRKLENENKIKSDTPGPGSYISFSEFGILVSRNRPKTKSIKKRINTENNSDIKVKNYFRKLMERARTTNNLRNSHF